MSEPSPLHPEPKPYAGESLAGVSAAAKQARIQLNAQQAAEAAELLRMSGVLTLLFPVMLIFTIILSVALRNNDNAIANAMVDFGTWGIVAGGVAGLVAIFLGHASGKHLDERWESARRLVLLAAYGEFFSPILVIFGFIGLMASFHD